MTLVASAAATIAAAVAAVIFLFASQAGGTGDKHRHDVGVYACKLVQFIETHDDSRKVDRAFVHFNQAEDAFGPGLGKWLVRHCPDPVPDPYYQLYPRG